MDERLRWVQTGYRGCTLSYQIRRGRQQMSSNYGAECNRRNRPCILTSARVSTTTHGAGHRRKWLISSPNHALRCSIPPPPHSTAHLRRRRSEVRPGCRESADEWRGVWSWPAPRVGPGVLLGIGAVPERPEGGLNLAQLTISRAGHVEPAHDHGLSRLQAQRKRLSDTMENAECGQRATERPCEMISRGSRHTGRGAAGEGGGRRLTCACRAGAAPFAAVDGERRHRRRGQIGGGAAEGRRASTRKAGSWIAPRRSYRGGRAALQGPGAAAPPPGRWAAAERAAADRCGRAER